MKNKNPSIKKQFKEASNYISESKHYIFISIILFIIASIAGFALSSQLSFIDAFLRALLEKTADLDTFGMIFFILQNNMQSSFLAILFGTLLGIFPLIGIFSNGIVLGYVLAKSSEIAGFTSWWRILPHGVFELPAIFISFGLGLSWGIKSIGNYFEVYKKDKRMSLAGVFIILITMIGIILNLFLFSQAKSDNITFLTSALILLASAISLTGIIIYAALFIFNPEKKIRSFQKILSYNSMNAFLMIVIPLLIIAAIIEGILIGVLS